MKITFLLIMVIFSLISKAEDQLIDNIPILFAEGDYFTIEEISKTKKVFKQDEAKLVTIALFKINNFQEAIKIGLKIYRKYPEVVFTLGQSFYALNEKSKAIIFSKGLPPLSLKGMYLFFIWLQLLKKIKNLN